jgi:hypothetical protein
MPDPSLTGVSLGPSGIFSVVALAPVTTVRSGRVLLSVGRALVWMDGAGPVSDGSALPGGSGLRMLPGVFSVVALAPVTTVRSGRVLLSVGRALVWMDGAGPVSDGSSLLGGSGLRMLRSSD